MVDGRAVRRTAALAVGLALAGCSTAPSTTTPSVAASAAVTSGSGPSVPAPPDVSVPPGQQLPKPPAGGFWMLGTLVPLSIAYLDGDTVVSTAEMVPCTTPAKQCPTYPSTGSYTAAVEAPAGFFPAHGVRPGTKVRIEGPTPSAG